MSTNILPYEGKFHCFIFSLLFPHHTDSALICFVYFLERFKFFSILVFECFYFVFQCALVSGKGKFGG